MLELIIIFFMMLYFVIAYVIVRSVWRSTSDRRLRTLSVAIAILLPSWDAVLSAIFFYTTCPFITKAAVYETAETEGIYYEGYLHNIVYVGRSWDGSELSVVLFANRDIAKGYQYVESLVNIQTSSAGKKTPVSPPIIYRCIEGPKDPGRPSMTFARCSPEEEIKSKYVIKSDSCKFALIEMEFMKIYNRSTGRLMAEYRGISKYPYTGIIIPFFTWLDWGDFKSNEFVRCPKEPQILEFQYGVLKKKS